MDKDEKSKVPWWQTVPGILTAAAAIITAVTGLILALHQAGLVGGADPKLSLTELRPMNPNALEGSSENDETKANLESIQPIPRTESGQASTTINLLSVENGGQLLLAPSDAWGIAVDGKEEDYREVKVGEDAVFAFKGERDATFDAFAMLIPKSGRNPKEFELLAGNESPTGAFRSIATFHPQNVRMMKTGGWQEFRFPPVTAKYLKVKLRSNYEDVVWLDLYEFRLLGQLKETGAR